MDPRYEPTHETDESRIGSQSRRTILRALAASSSVAALGGAVSAQDDEAGDDGMDEEMDEEAGDEDTITDEIPVAGEFPAGQTVGLQQVASNLPAPTDFDYVEVNGDVYHFIVTQTGQVFVTNLDEHLDGVEDEPVDADDDMEEQEEHEEDDETAAADIDDDEDEVEADPDPEDEDEIEDEELDTENDEPDTEDELDEETETEDEPEEFVFNGVIPAWFGMEPEELDGQENPTLELVAGETYQFTWENGDGQPHNVVILDAGDTILERTEIIQEAGETQTLEFEATEEMDRYVCEVHPGTMVGQIQVEEEDPNDVEEPAEETDALTPADMDLFLDIEDRVVSLGIGELGGYDERGLLGIAFHPEFAENRLFYVRYSAPERDGLGYNHTDVLAEFQADEDLQSVDPDSERTIMEIQQPQDNHNGGRLAFGPDGYLYISVGDGGNVHDIGIGHVDDWYAENEGGNGQDTAENLLGGIHRIDVDAEEDAAFGEYGIPDDNPLVGSEADLHEYWAWGFRNPWGMSIDDDGQMFVSDAGQHVVESIYTVDEGGNYSWNVKEGSFCFSTDSPLDPPAECPDEVGEEAGEARAGEPLRDPIAEYQHTRISEAFIDSSVVVGGHRYAGDAIPELEGAFVFGNWSSQGVAQADGEVLSAIDPGAAMDADGDEVEDEVADEDNGEDADGEDDDVVEETEETEDTEETAEPETNGNDLVDVDERWDLEELQFEGADDESLNRYVYSIERDQDGELYVLANTDFRPDPETGEIYKIVPAGEGEEVPAPEDPYVVTEEPDEEEVDPDAEEPDPDEDEADPDDEDPEDVGEDDEEGFPDGEDDENDDEDDPDTGATDEDDPDTGVTDEDDETDA